MAWDGKKTDPMMVRGYICAGCMKGGGTLEHVAGNRSPLIHHKCAELYRLRLVRARADAAAKAKVEAAV